MSSLLEQVRHEIVDLHDFFTDWFNGVADKSQWEPRFQSRLHPNFMFITPEGFIARIDDVAGAFAQGYGTNKDFRIQIRDVEVRHDMGSHVLATYTEWQVGAKRSEHENNARFTSVLIEKGTPFKWVHIQETWLPEAVRAAGSFDF